MMMINVEETLAFVQVVHEIKKLKHQNAALVEALKAITEVFYKNLIKSKEKVSISEIEDVCRQAKQALALAEGDKDGV